MQINAESIQRNAQSIRISTPCKTQSSISMAADRPLKRQRQNKVLPDNLIKVNYTKTSPVIVLALNASSNYALETRKLAKNRSKNGGSIRAKKRNVDKGKLVDDNCINVVECVSPYFSNKGKRKGDVGEDLGGQGKRIDVRRENFVLVNRGNDGYETLLGFERHAEVSDVMVKDKEKDRVLEGNQGGRETHVVVMNDDETRVVSPFFVKSGSVGKEKRKRKKKVCGEIQNAGRIVVEKRGIDGIYHRIEENEVDMAERNSCIGSLLDLRRRAGVSDMVVKHEEKYDVLEGKRGEREAPVSMTNDYEKTVVSPYFVKGGDGKEKEKKRRRKKSERYDQLWGKIVNVEKRENCGDISGRETSEQHVEDHWNSLREVLLVFQQKADVPDVVVKHEDRHEDFEEEKSGREFSAGLMNENANENANENENENEKRAVSPYFVKNNSKEKKQKQKRERKTHSDQSCGKIENVVKLVLEKKEIDCDPYDKEKNEQHFEDTNSPRGRVSLDLQRRVDSPYMVVKHEEKHEDLEEKERGRDLLESKMNDEEKRVAFPCIVKCDSKGEKTRKRKKKVQNDQPCGENETEAFNVMSPKVVSPYFVRKGGHGHENSKFECMKETEKKVRKPRNNKKRICEDSKELETEKEVKKQRKSKKKGTFVDQCCAKQSNTDKNLGLGLQSVVSAGVRMKMDSEAAHERGLKRIVVTLESASRQDLINQGNCTAKVDEEEPLHFLKINTSLNGQTLHGDQDDCDLMTSSINGKEKKKKKKKTVSPMCGSAAGLDPSSLSSSKEDLVHDNQHCPKASVTKVVSPYFENSLRENECDNGRDKADCKYQKKRRVDRTKYIKFEEVLSNYAYKGDNYLNKEEENGGKKEEDGSAGKGKKKGKKQQNGTLSAAEKRADAYQRKAPDCTWRPPLSPYNLLQEEHAHDPWRVLVTCMLLNITTGPQVKQVLSLFFNVCPNAEAAVNADNIRIASVIQSLGLHRKRATMIQQFSREYLSDDWTHVTQLHGIGK
ncbi:hypothetical protein SOVF_071870 [Spinacia oleracea]|nr:hypothetical protein SOVF_071870 [Spinacia oleracea]